MKYTILLYFYIFNIISLYIIFIVLNMNKILFELYFTEIVMSYQMGRNNETVAHDFGA